MFVNLYSVNSRLNNWNSLWLCLLNRNADSVSQMTEHWTVLLKIHIDVPNAGCTCATSRLSGTEEGLAGGSPPLSLCHRSPRLLRLLQGQEPAPLQGWLYSTIPGDSLFLHVSLLGGRSDSKIG